MRKSQDAFPTDCCIYSARVTRVPVTDRDLYMVKEAMRRLCLSPLLILMH